MTRMSNIWKNTTKLTRQIAKAISFMDCAMGTRRLRANPRLVQAAVQPIRMYWRNRWSVYLSGIKNLNMFC